MVILPLLCHGKIEVPPVEIRSKIIVEYHGSLLGGHKGITKTYGRFRERYTRPGLRNEISDFIRECRSCIEQKLARARTREPMLVTNTPAEPFQKVSLNTIRKLPTTPNGNKHILMMQDNFSKYCIAVPIPDLKTASIAHVVATTFFSQYSAARYILTDTGGSCIRKLIKHLERPLSTKIGDTVYAFKEVRDGKFDNRTPRPYTFAGFIENNNVILETEGGERLIKHNDKLLLAHC